MHILVLHDDDKNYLINVSNIDYIVGCKEYSGNHNSLVYMNNHVAGIFVNETIQEIINLVED
jgi:hypothetical protein